MEMPFGKYKGEEIADIPRPYLVWLSENVELFGSLKSEVEGVLNDEPPTENKSFDELLEEMNFTWE
jgi:hypothetical protein